MFQDLPVIFLPEPIGDEFVVRDKNTPDDDTESRRNEKITNQQLEGFDPVAFPLYSLHVGRSTETQKPSGSLPLVCYWVKQLRPRLFSRITGFHFYIQLFK